MENQAKYSFTISTLENMFQSERPFRLRSFRANPDLEVFRLWNAYINFSNESGREWFPRVHPQEPSGALGMMYKAAYHGLVSGDDHKRIMEGHWYFRQMN